MRFGSQVHHGIRAVFGQYARDTLGIADVDLLEAIGRVLAGSG